jgi:hypothetical protein
MTIKRAEVEQGEWEFRVCEKVNTEMYYQEAEDSVEASMILEEWKEVDIEEADGCWIEARPKGSKQPFQRVEE